MQYDPQLHVELRDVATGLWIWRAGREYVKRKSAEARSKGAKFGGSAVLAKIGKKRSVAIRLP